MPQYSYVAPMTASRVSARMLGLSRPPVDCSPRPSAMYAPRPPLSEDPNRARDPRKSAHVDDRRAQLGELSFGEVGMLAVEGIGDDQAEHRIAEEFQPLVGRQAAVLVGVGPMGQRPGHQRLRAADTKRCDQVGRRQRLRIGPAAHQRTCPWSTASTNASQGGRVSEHVVVDQDSEALRRELLLGDFGDLDGSAASPRPDHRQTGLRVQLGDRQLHHEAHGVAHDRQQCETGDDGHAALPPVMCGRHVQRTGAAAVDERGPWPRSDGERGRSRTARAAAPMQAATASGEDAP